ncbi:MAG: rod shape-determining protein MreD [Oscillospiraceae bacterium]|jgi:rod shape-determining protein MreD|nr:rod shape-determining protein MreD [Oscillospiraceae bacterium]
MALDKAKKRRALRWAVFALMILLTALAQSVPLLPDLWGVRALPLLPLVICAAVQEREIPSVLFGALGGLLWDVTASPRGFHALYLTAAAFVCAMLMRYLLNRNLLTVALLSAAATALYLLGRWLFGTLAAGLDRPFYLLLRYDLPALGYTLLFLPLQYAILHAAARRTARKRVAVAEEGEHPLNQTA